MRLARSIDTWRKTLSTSVTTGSHGQIVNCIDDAKTDILALHAEVERLQTAVKFYADAWCFTTNPKRPGLEWKPKEALLDDCGNIAREALAKATA